MTQRPTRRLRLRQPVRREGAEQYLFLTLVAFAATVLVTRAFLELTGYPQIGGGELHIAHALWGGLCLFVAAVLPIVLAGRNVYRASALLSGVGIGLFIDEVGKFITSRNDYFYPAAAPLIYLRVRRRRRPDPRSQLLTSLQLVEEAVDDDLQDHERDDLRDRLRFAAAHAPLEEQRRLAGSLLTFVESQDLELAPDAVSRLQPLYAWWEARRHRWLGGKGAYLALLVALFVSGVRAWVDLGVALSHLGGLDPVASTRLFSLGMLHAVVEAVAGALLISGSTLMGITGRDRLGASLAEYGLLVSLSLSDLASFYLRQFATLEIALFHGLLLWGVVAYRRQLVAQPRREAPVSVPLPERPARSGR